MSTAVVVEKSDGTMMSCASCGITGCEDVKLKDCSACYLVKYCNDECEKDHWPKHKKECKKRAAELHDEILFKQPESSHIGDCPICCLPLSIDDEQSIWNSCCCKLICTGCNLSNKKREIKERLEHKCPYCRKAVPKTEEQDLFL